MDFCSVDTFTAVANNATIRAAYCASDSYPLCLGICPNSDLSGIGVRVAFYLQSVMNALLIILSPDDAAGSAWSSAVLTGALVVPAINSKWKQELTLHHATLVLNFATLSTITSVASAPMVPIWRRVSKKGRSKGAIESEIADRTRGRIILSLALLTQIILQWAWTVLMFVSPYYDQNPCSGSTIIVFIGGMKTADEINEKYFGTWAIWLLLCIFGVLIFGVVMVFSCPSHIHETPISGWPDPPDNPTLKGRVAHWGATCRTYIVTDEHRVTRWWLRSAQVVAFSLVIAFIALSEKQIIVNPVLQGENEIFSFSQTAAIMLALAPAWPIAIAWLRRPDRLLPSTRQDSMDGIVYGPGDAFSPDKLTPSTPTRSAIQEHKQAVYDSPRSFAGSFTDLGGGRYAPVATADQEGYFDDFGDGSGEGNSSGSPIRTKKTVASRSAAMMHLHGSSASQDTVVASSSTSPPAYVPESYAMAGLGLLRSNSGNRNRSRSTLSISDTP